MSSAAIYLTFWLCSPGAPCNVFVAQDWLGPNVTQNRKACVTEQLKGNLKLTAYQGPGSRYFKCVTQGELKKAPLAQY